MDSLLSEIFSNIITYEIITNILKVTIGAELCFGALKWRKGALTTSAMGWGFVLGVLAAMAFSDQFGDGSGLIFILLGIIILPILTYTVPGVNRFVLGFLVSSKLAFMFTTVLAKEGEMDWITAFIMPLIMGAIVGLILMMWIEMRVSAFVLACTFLGASEIAPVVSEIINKVLFSLTGDLSLILDPTDLFFSLLKVELTDEWALAAMIILMIFGIRKQINSLKEHDIPLDTPLIGFESPYDKNGVIYTKDGPVDTM